MLKLFALQCIRERVFFVSLCVFWWHCIDSLDGPLALTSSAGKWERFGSFLMAA